MDDLIVQLSDHVANQIAAGEVVNRPASVVKELLENAVDAEATEIVVVVKDAGRTLIQVIDNGLGMGETDAKRCFTRHATSKITSAELIIPGSIILQKILMNCKSKSPITTAFAVNSDGNNGYAVRLFFDISIMGNEKYFEVITLDMDLKTHEKINFEPELEIFEKLDFAQIDSSGISKLFFKSICPN